jgi:hypothetical protein
LPSASMPHAMRHIRVHRIPSRVRGDRETPLWWDGTGALKPLIWGRRQAIFRKSESRQIGTTGTLRMTRMRRFSFSSGKSVIAHPFVSCPGRGAA